MELINNYRLQLKHMHVMCMDILPDKLDTWCVPAYNHDLVYNILLNL